MEQLIQKIIVFIITVITLILFLFGAQLAAQKSISISETTTKIKIDGIVDKQEWSAEPISVEFIQYAPEAGEPSQRKTDIAILYDEAYLYVLGIMHVNDASEIRSQLTPRDDVGSTDFFAFQMDPFGETREGYDFTVTAAGVQSEQKISGTDWYADFNVVWESAVKIYEDRWVVEMKIPFNSIRFPKENLSNFKVNFQRMSNALNEDSYWNAVKPEVDGYLNQFGALDGLKNVNPPLNLSFIPFTSLVYEKSATGRDKTTFNGGLDAKYVYKNAFTLDVSLIPDFSQAPSDDQIFNLSPFEVEYNENRQFFVEGTELFDKGGYLYTRRIGGSPIGRYDLSISDGEELIANPIASSVSSLVKFTGKTKKGISIGVLNGVTSKTHAEVRDVETGEIREIQTSPIQNYNALVVDKAMKNNSSLTLINNSVIRNGAAFDANLTAILYKVYDKKRNYRGYFKKAISQQYHSEGEDLFGHQYYAYLSRISGTWTGGVSMDFMDDTFDNNDFGYLDRNNRLNARVNLSYNKNEAGKVFSRYSLGLDHYQRYFASEGEQEFQYFKILANGTTKKNNTFFADFTVSQGGRNYYEPRDVGRFVNRADYTELFLEYQTNPNKALSWSGYVIFTDYNGIEAFSREFNCGHGIMLRAGQHLSFDIDQYYISAPSKAGYLTHADDEILFGKRAVDEFINSLRINYAVNADLNISMRLRHYWIQVDYSNHYLLGEEGNLLASDATIDVDAYDDNFNQFNIDVIATWQFAPASQMSLGYKLGSTYFDGDIRSKYFDNLGRTIEEPGNHTLSLKMTYFLDAGKF